MTLQQLTLAVEAAGKGSISAAAESLGISQPNASQAIKKLEEELGYSIFHRIGGGISPTDKGYAFLEHADAILRESLAIRAISGEEYVPRLRVGVTNFSPAVDAFEMFCEENREAASADLLCLNVSGDEATRLLRERVIDVAVTVIFKETLALATQLCKENNLDMITYCKIPLGVKLRKNHPLIEAGVLDGSLKGFQQLEKYPYVEYRQVEQVMSAYKREPLRHFGSSYTITVDEVDTRHALLSKTDAYSVGCIVDAEKYNRYNLAFVTIPGSEGTLASFIRHGDENLPGIARYSEILKGMFA